MFNTSLTWYKLVIILDHILLHRDTFFSISQGIVSFESGSQNKATLAVQLPSSVYDIVRSALRDADVDVLGSGVDVESPLRITQGVFSNTGLFLREKESTTDLPLVDGQILIVDFPGVIVKNLTKPIRISFRKNTVSYNYYKSSMYSY